MIGGAGLGVRLACLDPGGLKNSLVMSSLSGNGGGLNDGIGGKRFLELELAIFVFHFLT